MSKKKNGSYARNKGKAWEQDVARMFRETFPHFTFVRGTQDYAAKHQADVMGSNGWPFWVECKVGNTQTIPAAMKQAMDALAAAKSTQIPLVVSKRDREEPLATLRLSDFLSIMRGQL